MTIYPIKAFQDNYIWAIHDNSKMIVVDPGDAQPVIEFCHQHQLSLEAILITHHHNDHTGGIAQLKALWPDCVVYGPNNSAIVGIDKPLTDGDKLTLSAFNLVFEILAIPGHTLDHIAYFDGQHLFCGDTLFHAGCGRLFEGSPQQMLHSLKRLSALPPSTQVFCAHEYTLANLTFAQAVNPNDSDIAATITAVTQQRANGQPSLPTTIAEQRQINPFLRSQQTSVQQSVSDWAQLECRDELTTFTHLRRWKDQF